MATHCGASVSRPAAGAPARVTRAERARAAHLLSRLAFGPRRGEVELVAQRGVARWLDEQLAPEGLRDRPGERAVAPYRGALRPMEDLLRDYDQRDLDRMATAFDLARAATNPAGMTDEARMAPRTPSAPSAPGAPGAMPGGDCAAMPERERAACLQRARRTDVDALLAQVQSVALARAVSSERQLYEVLVAFWTDHFNVYARKGPTEWATGDFVERALRPHALGRFRELLGAVAHHPAMLVYLDNWRSYAARTDDRGRPSRGLNENYARELLELHTLGVDGGYTQLDVQSVARILTGWSTSDPQTGRFVFEFHPARHDRGEKTALGTRFEAGGGLDEGERLLDLLAAHPSTARFIARKLCRRLHSDDPPRALIEDVARAFTRSDGSIAATVRALVEHPLFFHRAARGAKVKSPFELVASTVRALGGSVEGVELVRVVARLGQPLYMQPSPVGYPDDARAWSSTASMLDRMNLTVAVGHNRVPGLRWSPDSVLAPTLRGDALVQGVEQLLFPLGPSATTHAALARIVNAVRNPTEARALAVGLALASPEFQHR